MCVQQSLPMRHKSIHWLNVPAPIKFAYDFFQTRLSSKINERMKVSAFINIIIMISSFKRLERNRGGQFNVMIGKYIFS